MNAAFAEDRDPPTEVMGALESVTTAGAPATLSLQHLHSLRSALEPLRAAYVNAAFDRLRGLPAESRRTLLPHVLHEHPELASEPRIRAIAHELGVDVERAANRPDVAQWLALISGVRVESGREALDRVARALDLFARAVADLARRRQELTEHLDASAHAPVPDARDVLQRALDPHTSHVDPLTDLTLHATAVIDAAREAAQTVLDANDAALFAAETSVPKWWPSPFREAALWSRTRAGQKSGRAERGRAFDDAFARAYLARVDRTR